MEDKMNDIFPKLKRNRYFVGKVLSADDFETEQQYFVNRLKLHNRFLHGYGVVSGLNVTLSDGVRPAVTISPGLALDPEGHEVIVSSPQQGPMPENGDVAYLCIRWAERETDKFPVPGEPTGRLDLIEASKVEEYAILKFENTCPSVKQKRPCEDGIGCGDQHGVALAHLVKRHGVWKIDKRFRVHRVCRGK
jgi:hypothetical protein